MDESHDAASWQKERQSFREQLPDLLKTHRDLYVAIYQGKVVESGSDKLDVGGRAYARFGYVPIYVGLVSDQPQPIIRIPSPRHLRHSRS